MENQTPVEWLVQQYEHKIGKSITTILKEEIEQAKQMEEERDYETKCYWFGRGIHAGRENKIEELKPKK